MNCKPGDLAIYVGFANELLGQVFRCIAINEGGTAAFGEPIWDVDRRHSWGHSNIRDSSLRPIRPGDISDEEVRDLYLPKIPEAANA